MNRKATAAVLGAGSLWGVISIFVRNLNAMGLTAIQISFLRAMGGAAVMVLFLALTRRDLLKIKLRHIWYFVGTGIISLALFNLCYFTVIELSQASIAVVLLYTSPIFIMVISAIVFKEKITWNKLLALAMVFVGCVLVAGLLGMTPDDIRIPDSFELAKKEGLDFRFLDGNIRDAHPNTACLDVMDGSGRTLEVQASSLGGGRIMLNKLDGTQIDVTAERPALIVHNVDKPGLVAIVTSLLARESINIATMNLYRSKRGGDAVMVTEVDQNIPEALVEDLKKVDGILKVTCLNI